MQERLRLLIGEHARAKQTDHFIIAYDTDYDVVRSLAGRLEGTYDAVWRTFARFDFPAVAPDEPLGILLFDGYKSFTKYQASVDVRGGGVAGFYYPVTNLSAFYNALTGPQMKPINAQIKRTSKQLERLGKGGSRSGTNRRRLQALQSTLVGWNAQRDAYIDTVNRLVIQHEAAHQLLFNIGVHVRGGVNPTWFVEGMACQFEVAQSGGKSGPARVNHVRLADFRDELGLDPQARKISPQQLEAAFAQKRLLRLPELIGSQTPFVGPAAHGTARYAESWALTYYLHRRHTDAFSTYLKQVSSRQAGVAVSSQEEREIFEASFGPIDDTFEKAWIKFIVRLRLDRQTAGR